ncbi:LysR family transcriptional regulator [Psychromonas aquimarina]|uniref:LysR family transcriptional regulator n=1 Tax=Psychromonas aquimarina TaxID=444919 RepID=UPI0004055B40|nr:LysR family transcriptional regulator [Psychromonas aquimarina]
MIQYNLEQLAAFVAVSECGSFTKAARRLKKNRSTLSEHVANLEIALELTLFDRNNNVPKLTEAGRLLLRQASILLNQSVKLQNTALMLNNEEENELSICLDLTVPDQLVYQVNRHISSLFSETKIHWIYAGREEALNRLVNLDVDLAIVIQNQSFKRLLPPNGLGCCVLGDLPGAMYTRIDSPLQSLAPVTFQDLQLENRYVLNSFADAGFSERASYSDHQQIIGKETLLLELLQSSGWAFLPRHVAEDERYHNTIKELKNYHLNDSWAIGHILFFSENNKGKVLEEIITELKNQYRLLLKR